MIFGLKSKNIIASCFLVFTAAYCMFFLYKPGFIGYANNYDFIRHSSCIGLWSYIPGHPKEAGHPSTPSDKLLYDGSILKDVCIKSSDNVSSYIVTRFLSIDDVVSFVRLSSVKIVFLLVLSFFSILLSKSKLVPSLVLFGILTEWIYLAYANTLYGEFSVISAFVLIIICTYNLIYEKSIKCSKLHALILILSIIWLGLSKQQWSYFSFLLVCVSFWVIFQRTLLKKFSFIFLFFSLVSVSAFQIINKDSFKNEGSINSANRINTFFQAVLPEATDQLKALRTLDLPERCDADIGKSWYHPEQNALNNCPEIQAASRTKLLKLFIQDPATFYMPIVKFTDEMKLFYPDYLGLTVSGDADALKKFEYLKKISISNVINKIDSSVFFIITLVFFIVAIVIGLILFFIPKSMPLNLVSYMYLFTAGGLTTGYSIVSSVFGDGYIEAAKHAVLFLGGFYIQFIALLCILFFLAASVLKKHKIPEITAQLK